MEILFYGGIAVMALAVAGALASFVVFRSSGEKLKTQLEKEYGKERR